MIVYFDGACPVCRKEISIYQNLRPLRPIEWVDVSQHTDLGPDLTQAQALAVFHVRTEHGRLLKGAAAFAQMWQSFSGWRWLGLLVATPGVLQIAEVGYRIFLQVRKIWR
jgi:3-demethoxyubiquinol 3-hydroxylase